MSDSVRPHSWPGPPGSPVPGILWARALEWVAISFSNAWTWKVKVKSLSRVWLLATPWTAAYQAPLSMGFSRQAYCSGVPLPSLLLGLSSVLFLQHHSKLETKSIQLSTSEQWFPRGMSWMLAKDGCFSTLQTWRARASRHASYPASLASRLVFETHPTPLSWAQTPTVLTRVFSPLLICMSSAW